MDIRKIEKVRSKIAAEMKERYESRVEERRKKQKEISEKGIEGAAGKRCSKGRREHIGRFMPGTFEKIDRINDLAGINFLGYGQKASLPVCRLTYFNNPIGTGFLVAPGLLLTNNHVIGNVADAKVMTAEFNFELNTNNAPLTPAHFQLEPDDIFVTTDNYELDFTFVKVALSSSNGADIREFGWLPLHPLTNKILEGEPIVVIQHPQGRVKSICLFNSFLEDRTGNFLHYTTDTEPGSSGSPAFSRHWQVVGLHHAGEIIGKNDKGEEMAINEGIRISKILKALISSEQVVGPRKQLYDRLTDPKIYRDGRPVVISNISRVTAEFSDENEFESRATKIRRRNSDHYKGRKGYQSQFLGKGKLRVSLPKLPNWLKTDQVKITGSKQVELKYEHFSLVMSESRRMPYFTAVNIDGKSAESIKRKDRDPNNQFESANFEAAADKWFYDPRINEKHQVGPEVYDETDFDFGHVVRRLAPVWGSKRSKRIANDDTFHMTNCFPQHKNWNRKSWISLEKAILRSAKEEGKRYSVFTGPIFDARDPFIFGVQVPLGGWKVVVYKSHKKLEAMGFIQWQDEMVDEIIDSLESLPIDRIKDAWRYSIGEIGRLTNLDFGNLIGSDAFEFESLKKRVKVTDGLLNRLFPY